MNYVLKYADRYIDFSLDNISVLGELYPNTDFPFDTEEDAVLNCLNNPIGQKPLHQVVNTDDTICLIVSDITRAYQRMYIYLPYIIKEIQSAGVADENITIILANGTHRQHTSDEKEKILTKDIANKFTIIDHDCECEDELVSIGTTSYGTPVKINKHAYNADHVILTGAIGYHMMAGYGGGRKSVLPGISARETIMRNHSHSMSPIIGDGPNTACDCKTDATNPINLDMAEAMDMLEPSFLFNVILGGGKIIDAVCGNPALAFKEGCNLLSKYSDVRIDKYADMVIASAGGYPKDINYYQSTKTIYNAMRCVKPNGTIIILADCKEGFGNDEVSYMITKFNTNLQREKELKDDYTIGKFISFLALWYAEKYNIIYVTSLDNEMFANCNINIVNNIEDAIALADKLSNEPINTTYIMYDGGLFPTIN